MRQVRRHVVPAWWRDAKLGIFVHWTPASVPAFAPVGVDMGELLAQRRPDALAWSPYAEWYQNSLAFPQSPVAEHHRRVYGDRPYNQFARDWEAGLATWDPDDWARRFAATGARYVVLVTKHHDGYCLWPTEVRNPHVSGLFSERDVVGELAEAVRGQGMRFGVYYSGGLDWTFNDHPLGTFSDLVLAQPGGDYPAYAEAQVRELIDRYRPVGAVERHLLAGLDAQAGPAAGRLLPGRARRRGQRPVHAPVSGLGDRAALLPPAGCWTWPRPARPRPTRASSHPSHRCSTCARPSTRPSTRSRPRPGSACAASTPASATTSSPTRPTSCRRRDLLWSWIDIVAKGGNLLLNVGPRGVDATIAPAQVQRLDWLAEFTERCGPALFATRPWIIPGDRAGPAEVRYTTADRRLYAHLRSGEPGVTSVTLAEVSPSPTTTVTSSAGRPLTWEFGAGGLTVTLDAPLDDTDPTVVILTDAAARSRQPT